MTSKVLQAYRAVFARPAFYKINDLVYRMGLSGMGVLNYENNYVSGEEYFVRRFLSNRKAGIVLDVGANIGDYSALVLSSNRDLVVHAFEPNPTTFKKLKSRFGLRVTCHNSAVGDVHGELALFDHSDSLGSQHATLYRSVIEEIHKGKARSTNVEVVTIDDFLEQNAINCVALLKIDTEGHEKAVLKGATNAIKRGVVEIVHFEFNEMNVASRTFFRDIWEMLSEYVLFRLLPTGLLLLRSYKPLTCEIFAFQNVVAIRRDIAEKLALR